MRPTLSSANRSDFKSAAIPIGNRRLHILAIGASLSCSLKLKHTMKLKAMHARLLQCTLAAWTMANTCKKDSAVHFEAARRCKLALPLERHSLLFPKPPFLYQAALNAQGCSFACGADTGSQEPLSAFLRKHLHAQAFPAGSIESSSC